MAGPLHAFLDGDLAGAKLVGVLVALALVVVLRLVLPERRLARQPFALLVAHVAALALAQAVPAESTAHRFLGPLALLLLLLSIGRSTVLLVLDGVVGRRFGRPLPRIF